MGGWIALAIVGFIGLTITASGLRDPEPKPPTREEEIRDVVFWALVLGLALLMIGLRA